ncbi:glycosyltransferase family 2 protein [Candidatus Pantoea floridensis]|uniref:Glycosyltransferase involved in cell wall bisynthesis n=1 Tax=Candidatus Pantoea floridensis TaxID=1938870 RepID=A0A286BXP8_9GAMM|nr:glycosyltransferase family 2 protein [Pantoea floridensis]PIF21356.1 glycosyltransferase involved in cell wall biosynthesis [Enterobacteriaceae bacterium JKS000233]SOD38868.1 Glycosyltransferase involved in cell wall bisynthesis [Pantoea floridensis]
MSVSKKKISLIAPFYNEEKNAHLFFERVDKVFENIKEKYNYEVVCINDGSNDNTLNELIRLKNESFPMLKIINFSRNFGKEAAVTAGIDFADGDAFIPIDSDLQHPPELILEMINKWESGFDVILAKRKSRATDRKIQRVTANLFYSLSSKISHTNIPADVGDFRLFDKSVALELRKLRETNRFMKGLFAWVGFKTTYVEYNVEPRQHGKTSFNTWKLWNFALEAITSFSTIPLRIWSYIGVIISIFSMVYAVFLVVKTMFFGNPTPGYASLMVAILFFSGVQLIGIGILGEYIARISNEVRNRPIYIIKDIF